MKELENYLELEDLLEKKETFILYAHSKACGVCEAFLPRVKELADTYRMPLYGALIETLPEFRGQLGIYTVPVLVLYYEGKDYLRQARFLDLGEVKRILDQMF